uniref:Integrase catalytic domain-containing protein n=1 Tax=Caenorhabditis tropicalis TaxID=1561998 RepID=A0A1I7UDU7_9PELO
MKQDEERIELLKLRLAERKKELEEAELQRQLEELNEPSALMDAKEQCKSPANNADKNPEKLATSAPNDVESAKFEAMLLNMNAFLNAQAATQAKQQEELIKALSTLHNTTQNTDRKQHNAYNAESNDEEEEQQQQEADDTHQKPYPAASVLPESQSAVRRSHIRIDTLLNLMDKFDGSTDYELFRTQFKSTVLDDKSIDPREQQLTLTNLLKGDALACRRYKSDPVQSVRATLDALDKVYGRDNKEHSLREKLLKLPFHQTDPQRMRLNLASHTSILERLEESGHPVTDMETVWAIGGKLPPKMQSKFAEYVSLRGNEISIEEAVSRITVLIEAGATEKILAAHKPKAAINEIPETYGTINYAVGQNSRAPRAPRVDPNAPLAYDPSLYTKRYKDPATSELLAGYYALGSGPNYDAIGRTFPLPVGVRDGRCHVCNGAHRAIRCTLSSADFRKALTDNHKCHICTGAHPITECRNKNRCIYCSGLHHTGGCTKKEFFRDPKNLPAGCAPITFFRPSRGTRRQ